MTPKFKVGDKVVLVNPYNITEVPEGSVGIVIALLPSKYGSKYDQIRVNFIEYGEQAGLYCTRFRHYTKLYEALK